VYVYVFYFFIVVEAWSRPSLSQIWWIWGFWRGLWRVARHGTEVDPLISAISRSGVTGGGQLSDGRSSGRCQI